MWIVQQIVTAFRDLDPEARRFILVSHLVVAVLLAWPALAALLDSVAP